FLQNFAVAAALQHENSPPATQTAPPRAKPRCALPLVGESAVRDKPIPAAVRSGPRWLVMQLRQPMMLEAVSVRDWDGQWLAAAPVGSPVSAVGASSLPLELQLEDPCRASWEAFGSSDRWRQIGLRSQKQQAEFEFTANFSLHGALLTCLLPDRPGIRIEQTIGIVVTPSVELSLSTVWVIGRRAKVYFFSSPAYPPQQHRCQIISGSSTWELNEHFSKTRQAYIRNSINMSLTEVKSEFVVTVTSAMLNGTQDGFSSTHRLNIMKQEQKTDWLRAAPQLNHHQVDSSQSVSRGGPPPAESSCRGNESQPTSSQEIDPVYEEVSLCVYRPVHPLPRYPRQFSEKNCRHAYYSSRFD
uniref:SHR-BD domain-containing protein n=1 Tax=Macrostomum lignano TaxID=282301 RepID=A0A1I8G6G7_9PLAT